MEVGKFATVLRFRLKWIKIYFNHQHHAYMTSACLKITVTSDTRELSH